MCAAAYASYLTDIWHNSSINHINVFLCVFLEWSLFGSEHVILRRPQEQTLFLQNKSRSCQLAKLGEVEKRFSALSRKCALVTQAHRNLQQNGEEDTQAGRRHISMLSYFGILVNDAGYCIKQLQ